METWWLLFIEDFLNDYCALSYDQAAAYHCWSWFILVDVEWYLVILIDINNLKLSSFGPINNFHINKNCTYIFLLFFFTTWLLFYIFLVLFLYFFTSLFCLFYSSTFHLFYFSIFLLNNLFFLLLFSTIFSTFLPFLIFNFYFFLSLSSFTFFLSYFSTS